MNLPLAIAVVLALPVSFIGVLACGFVLKSAITGKRQQHDREPTPVETVPAAADNQPGTHLADLDQCELIWATPDPAGLDELRQAIRDEQQKGEAS